MARSHADIVEAILVHLRTWKRKRREADIRAEVEKRIALLVKAAARIDQGPRGAEVRRQAAQARKTLARLRKQLAREPLRSFIGPHIAISQSVEGLDRLDEILANMKLIKFPDPRSKPKQRLCAEAADALIYELSANPATGTADRALHTIASLLYEAITGKPNQDLKRAVDAMIKSWRGLDSKGGRGRPLSGPIERDKWEHDIARSRNGVSQQTIGRDLGTLSTMDNVKGQGRDTLGIRRKTAE